jgi:hypothetical protein
MILGFMVWWPVGFMVLAFINVERFDNFAEYLRLFGEDAADEACCAPIAFGNGRERLMSRLRSAVSPWLDCRNEFDKARDRITEFAE